MCAKKNASFAVRKLHSRSGSLKTSVDFIRREISKIKFLNVSISFVGRITLVRISHLRVNHYLISFILYLVPQCNQPAAGIQQTIARLHDSNRDFAFSAVGGKVLPGLDSFRALNHLEVKLIRLLPTSTVPAAVWGRYNDYIS